MQLFPVATLYISYIKPTKCTCAVFVHHRFTFILHSTSWFYRSIELGISVLVELIWLERS